jgi:hypothetical protein
VAARSSLAGWRANNRTFAMSKMFIIIESE